jgi:thiamine-phosphate diphosphorylase
MLFCLVTDRRRLAAAIGAGPREAQDALLEQVAAAASAGVDLIQIREPDLEGAELASLVRSILNVTAATASKVLVNDRLDVALATGAAGVHLREAGVLPAEVRRIAPPGFTIGCSVHTTAAISARKAADFFIAGTVMPTASKPAVDYLYEDGLKRIVEAAAGQPVLGIGGLDRQSIPMLASARAAGMAAIGTFIPAAGEGVFEFVQKRVRELRFALESASSQN